MDTLGAMRAFLSVLDHGSLTAGARALDLTPSAVSKQLAGLEAQLGAQLLKRTTRRVGLTRAGARFAEEARGIVARFEAAVAAVSSDAEQPRGRLKVTAPQGLAEAVLAPALPGFWENYPRIELDLHLTDRVVNLVAEDFDVAIRVGILPDSSLIALRLASNPHLLCATPEYLQARGVPLRPRDLGSHTCVTDRWSQTLHWRFYHAGQEVSVDVHPLLYCNSSRVLARVVRAGKGIGMLPRVLVQDDLEQGRLVAVLEDQLVPPASAVHALYVERRPLPARLRVFLEFLRTVFAGL